ncbi:MAG: ribonuclease HII [Anaerolineales bacterium]|jgi:ribonuclease HII
MARKFDRSLLPPFPDLQFEWELWEAGIVYVAGIDEAGRGALAGPVAAGVVILPKMIEIQDTLRGVRDSKQLTPKARDHWLGVIEGCAVSCQVGYASAEEIDALGIAPATRLAARRALEGTKPGPQHLLIDWISLPEVELPGTSLVKGDARSLSIACASIAAKVRRDEILIELDESYPGYGFTDNKGYGTAKHLDAIRELGACPVHRRSFSPLREAQ